MFKAFSTGWQLVEESYTVLKRDKSLALFPIISGVAVTLLFLVFLAPIALSGGFHGGGNNRPDVVTYAVLFVYYVLMYSIIIFFNAGLVACARQVLKGETPTFQYGLQAASDRIGKIFAWAVISATVGIVLRIISDDSNLIGKIIAALLGTAWSLMTFFVVPIIVLEDVGPVKAIEESWELFKKTWGPNFTGSFYIGLIFFLFALVGLVPIFAAIAVSTGMVALGVIALVVLYWAALAIISSSLTQIFVTALYVYAKTGDVPLGYNRDLVENAFRPR